MSQLTTILRPPSPLARLWFAWNGVSIHKTVPPQDIHITSNNASYRRTFQTGSRFFNHWLGFVEGTQ